MHATDLIAEALRADKVDAFLYDPTRDALEAVGSSNQPLSALQRKHGLDFLPIANGGRVVWVFQNWKTYVTGLSRRIRRSSKASRRRCGSARSSEFRWRWRGSGGA
jgi:hypothetical protein